MPITVSVDEGGRQDSTLSNSDDTTGGQFKKAPTQVCGQLSMYNKLCNRSNGLTLHVCLVEFCK